MGTGSQRMDHKDGAWSGKGHRNWKRMLQTQALLLSCLALRSSASILPYDTEADNFCKDECFVGRGNSMPTPCNSSVAKQLTRRACDMEGNLEVFRINANDKARWDVLAVTNASIVMLETTKLVQKIYLKRVPNVVLDSSRTQSDGFSYLKLEDCQIGQKYSMSFDSLKELHIIGSKIGVIMQTSMNEIDILKGSHIMKLSAGIERSRSTFQDSALDTVEMLHINGNAKIVMTNMTINDVQSLKYSSTSSSTVSSSYIQKITSLSSQPSSGELEFDGVEVGEIVSNGVTIMGTVKISNSVIHKSPIDGILICSLGEITFRNVTVNGVQLSYTLKGDPSSNGTVTALHLSVMTFSHLIACWVIIAVLAAVIVVLLYCTINQAVAKRNSNAADDPGNKNLKANDPGKVTANHYTTNIKSEDIPMATRNEPGSNGPAAMPQSVGSASQKLLTPPPLSASQGSFDVSQLPLLHPQMLPNSANTPEPMYDDIEGGQSDTKKSSQLPLPHPQMLSNRANTPQPLYDDVEGGQSDTKNSFLYNRMKPSVGPGLALHPEVSSHAPRTMLPHQRANPVASAPALPVPSHYARRGQMKPSPPSRKPPTLRQISPPTGVHGLPPVQFHSTPAANMPDYQDTVPEEPLYALEDELRNY